MNSSFFNDQGPFWNGEVGLELKGQSSSSWLFTFAGETFGVGGKDGGGTGQVIIGEVVGI